MKTSTRKNTKTKLWPAIVLAVLVVFFAGLVCDPPLWKTAEPVHSAPLFAPDAVDAVNINTATLQELMLLPGIGEKRAADILRFREEHGKFSSVQQLLEIDGIGNGILEGLQGKVSL